MIFLYVDLTNNFKINKLILISQLMEKLLDQNNIKLRL